MACYEYKGVKYTEGELFKLLQSQQPKTRRILELQSDLFQKGRDVEDLIKGNIKNTKEVTFEEYNEAKEKGKQIIVSESGDKGYEYKGNIYELAYENEKIVPVVQITNKEQNQFLQLLNKDNNWVTFFIKSIIQDSAKKGYEKVLFPTGNTASKVEGHETLEEFKKQKEDRIKQLEKQKATDFYQETEGKFAGMWLGKDKPYKDKRFAEASFDNEINQLKQELERVEVEGFGALKPIYNFYENTVTNILKKNGYNPVEITDEHGNSWYEVVVPKSTKIFLEIGTPEVSKKPLDTEVRERLLQVLNRNGISVMAMSEYEQGYELRHGKAKPTALADTLNKVIAIDESSESALTMPEEAMHMAVASQVGTAEFNRAMRLVTLTDEYTREYAKYAEAYSAQGLSGEALDRKIKMEVLGKIGAQSLFSNLKEATQGSGVLRWLRRMWNKFISIIRGSKSELERILDTWASDFVKGGSTITDSGVFFDIDDPILEYGQDLYDSMMTKLLNRYKFMQRIGRDREYLRDRYYDLRTLEYSEGILKFLSHAKEDFKVALDTIKEIKTGKKNYTSNTHRDIKFMTGYYDAEIRRLEKYFDPIIRTDGVFTDKQIKKANKTLAKLSAKLRAVENFNREYGTKHTLSQVKQQAAETITDPKLLKQEYGILDRTVRAVDYDSNRAMYWFGSLVHSRDSFARWLNYAVTKVRREVDRFTYNLGKELTALAAELKVTDTSKFIEKDDKGKFTHYFIDKFRTAAFMKAQDEFHTRMHKKYGLPEDKYARGVIKQIWRDAADAVAKGNATTEQIEQAKRLNEYNTEIAQWFSKNTTPVEGWEKIVEEVKKKLGGGTTDAFKEWKRENIGIAQRGTKYEYEYPKGELITPSDGRVTKRGKFTTQTVDWRNADYAKLSANEITMLNKLIGIMSAMDERIPKKRHKLQLPQIKATHLDLLKRGKFNGIFERVKDLGRLAEDDTEYGDDYQVERPDGSLAQFVPIYFINQLERADEISPDLISSVIAYADVMENFRRMSSNASMFEMVLDTIGAREVKANRKKYLGDQSEVYKSMEKFIEMNVYGKWKDKWIVGGVNITKLMQNLVKFVTANNLAFSLYTTLASYFTSSTYSKIEDLVGQYTTNRDKLFAEKVWDTNIHQVLIESGKINKTSKLGLFFEHHRILKRNQDIFANLDKSRLTRKAIDSGLFWSYELVKLRTRGKLALAIASNYRLYNDKFYTRKELEALGVTDIDKLKSYWDTLEVQNGKLVSTSSDKSIEDTIERKVEYIGNNIDGELNYSDWAAAHQGALAQLVTTHRGWMFRNVQLRLKPKGVNYQTGEVEEGFYLTFWDFMKRTFFSKERVTTLKGLLAHWDTLEPYEKQGVHRVLWEIAFIHAVAALALMLNNLAGDDDEDDSLIQYLAYQSNRVLLELGVMNPTPVLVVDPLTGDFAFRLPLIANIQEMTAILNSPVAASRQIDDLMDLTYLFSNEEIKSGPYEGMTKLERLGVKIIPGTKGLYQARDPKSRNTFLKNKTLNWTQND